MICRKEANTQTFLVRLAYRSVFMVSSMLVAEGLMVAIMMVLLLPVKRRSTVKWLVAIGLSERCIL